LCPGCTVHLGLLHQTTPPSCFHGAIAGAMLIFFSVPASTHVPRGTISPNLLCIGSNPTPRQNLNILACATANGANSGHVWLLASQACTRIRVYFKCTFAHTHTIHWGLRHTRGHPPAPAATPAHSQAGAACLWLTCFSL